MNKKEKNQQQSAPVLPIGKEQVRQAARILANCQEETRTAVLALLAAAGESPEEPEESEGVPHGNV